MTSNPANQLALWIRWNMPAVPEPMTHLKLQKLGFYCYGVALAFGVENDIGEVDFEAWAHGPVNRTVWRHYRAHGSQPMLAPVEQPPTYPSLATQHLTDVMQVYGRLTAWKLRQETHLEKPWAEAWQRPSRRIDREELRAHFQVKFTQGHVAYPEYLFGSSNFALDRIPIPTFPSLRAMALDMARRPAY